MSDVKSEALLTVIMSRAHAVSVARDPRLTMTTKFVAMLLWSITETWAKGEARSISFDELAEQIRWDSNGTVKTAGRHTIKSAIKDLEEAGYILVDRTGCGRHKPASIKMVRRALGSEHTMDRSGHFRVWTGSQMERYEEATAAILEDPIGDDAGSEEGLKGVGGATPLVEKGLVDQPHSEKGVGGPTPLGRKGLVGEPPIKETSLSRPDHPEGDLSKQTLPPSASAPPPRTVPSVSMPDADAPEHVHAPDVVQAAWERLSTPAALLAFFASSLPPAEAKELDGRKRAEVTTGLSHLIAAKRTAPEIVLGLGFWVADRGMANADILSEVITKRLGHLSYDVASLGEASPQDLLDEGRRHGAAYRSRRKGRFTVVGEEGVVNG